MASEEEFSNLSIKEDIPSRTVNNIGDGLIPEPQLQESPFAIEELTYESFLYGLKNAIELMTKLLALKPNTIISTMASWRLDPSWKNNQCRIEQAEELGYAMREHFRPLKSFTTTDPSDSATWIHVGQLHNSDSYFVYQFESKTGDKIRDALSPHPELAELQGNIMSTGAADTYLHGLPGQKDRIVAGDRSISLAAFFEMAVSPFMTGKYSLEQKCLTFFETWRTNLVFAVNLRHGDPNNDTQSSVMTILRPTGSAQWWKDQYEPYDESHPDILAVCRAANLDLEATTDKKWGFYIWEFCSRDEGYDLLHAAAVEHNREDFYDLHITWTAKELSGLVKEAKDFADRNRCAVLSDEDITFNKNFGMWPTHETGIIVGGTRKMMKARSGIELIL